MSRPELLTDERVAELERETLAIANDAADFQGGGRVALINLHLAMALAELRFRRGTARPGTWKGWDFLIAAACLLAFAVVVAAGRLDALPGWASRWMLAAFLLGAAFQSAFGFYVRHR